MLSRKMKDVTGRCYRLSVLFIQMDDTIVYGYTDGDDLVDKDNAGERGVGT